jgi:hypothetical protein
MLPDPSPLPPSDNSQDETSAGFHDCFHGCPAASFTPLCSARIDPECLSIELNGAVRVSLSVPLSVWFDFLAGLGDVLQLARSPVAVLAVSGSAPVLMNHGSTLLPRSECGLFAPNLAEFASLWALREVFPDGPLYLLEVRDARGRSAQRIVIPPGDARLAFQEFVCAHQSPARLCRPWFPPNHASSAQRRASLAGRIPWLQRRLEKGACDVRKLEWRQVETLLARAVAESQCLRTMHYNHALVCGAVWTPEMHAARMPDEPAWPNVARFFGQGTALELRRDCPASAWLWTGQCSCCSDEKWAVEIGGPDDELALALNAPDESHETDWRDFLQPLL